MARVIPSIKVTKELNLDETGEIKLTSQDESGIKLGFITSTATFTVPGIGTVEKYPGLSSATFYVWGAGGGASSDNLTGGGSGYATRTLSSGTWTSIGYSVGYPGRQALNNLGTAAKGGNVGGDGGSGGSASIVTTINGATHTLRVCGGGGGGGAKITTIHGGGGGEGGGNPGIDGTVVGRGAGLGGGGGSGGTSGGGGGTSGGNMSLNASSINNLGGDGGINTDSNGGGGGGGYGGGGGGSIAGGSSEYAGGGGGAGGYGSTTTAGSGTTPGNTGSAYYAAPAGVGGTVGDGEAGRVVIVQISRAFDFSVGMITAHMNPRVDNKYDCGTASYRWRDIYSTSGSVNTSDRNDKTDIKKCHLSLDFIRALRPVSYKYKWGHRKHYGFVAQDVELIVNHLNKGDFAGFVRSELIDGGKRCGLRYNEFIAPIVDALQVLCTKLDAIEGVLVKNNLMDIKMLTNVDVNVNKMPKLPSEMTNNELAIAGYLKLARGDEKKEVEKDMEVRDQINKK